MGADAYGRRPMAPLPSIAAGAITYLGGYSILDLQPSDVVRWDADTVPPRLRSRLASLLRDIEAEGFYKGPRFPFERVWFRRY